MEPINIPIEDELDLHTFAPGEVPDLLNEYLHACTIKGFVEVRLIHGKGSGRLRQLVRTVLQNHPLVQWFQDAPPGAGGWGATLVRLRQL